MLRFRPRGQVIFVKMNKQLQTILHNNMKKHIQTKRTKQYCMSENDTKKEIQKVID